MKRAALLCLALVAAILLLGYRKAVADPVVRSATIKLPSWPARSAPVRIVLLSDLHVGNLAVGRRRLARIVAQVNAVRPDLILIAGDFFPGNDPIDAVGATSLLAPLKGLRARLGVVAVPGNHDHWTGLAAVRTALATAGVTLLANQVQRRGPLVIGGIDDAFSGNARTVAVVAAMRALPGPRLILTHSPNVAAQLPADVPLLLAGHTHCGQVVLPWLGSAADDRYYDGRYRCGIVVEGSRTVVVTGGIGGSLPFRIGAPPDLWLLTLGP